MASKYDKYIPKVLKLHKQRFSNVDIGKKLRIDGRRVSEILRKNNLKGYGKSFNADPTPLQHEFFIANAIGDGSIYKSKANANYRMNLAHSLKQKDYFLMKYEAVKDFIGVNYTVMSQFDKRTKETYKCVKYQTRVHPYFTNLYKEWYENGKPVIREVNKEEITKRVIAYKFYDDGFKFQNGGLGIAMNDFDSKSIEVLRKRIKELVNIRTTVHSNNGIYIPVEEKDKFASCVRPYATNDVLYKLGEFMGTPSK